MKIKTKVRISFVLLSLIPLLLILVIVSGLSLLNKNTMENKYGITNKAGMDVMYNPLSLIGNMTSAVMNDLEATIAGTPERMEDMNYLNEVNERLLSQDSCLIIKKNGEIVYNGSEYSENVEFSEDELVDIHGPEMNIYLMQQGQYHLRIRSFDYLDGSRGTAYIITSVDDLINRTRGTLIQSFIIVIVIFLFMGAIILFYLYNSIIKPVNELKKAALEIKEGNLDYSVDAASDDEIGELCVSFEEMRQKLKEQVDITMQFEKDNKELISNISHDLKTPITAIKGYVEGIMDGVADTPEKQERYLKTIYTKANDMQRLIEDLSLYAKLDSNTMVYSFCKVNLNDYFDDCIEELQMDLESKGIGLSYTNEVAKDVLIIADTEQLKRVILNIINNAAKYIDNPKGLVNIKIHDEPEFIQVEIEDNGKGIAPGEIVHIFERGYRTDSSRNSTKGGSGFGLSICKKIIEEHGGRIWATSKVGEGTSICFVLRKYEENRIYE